MVEGGRGLRLALEALAGHVLAADPLRDRLDGHEAADDVFFSSGRRHTSSYGDWSSDVCSSDLATCEPGRSCPTRSSTSCRPSTRFTWARLAIRGSTTRSTQPGCCSGFGSNWTSGSTCGPHGCWRPG